MSHMNEVATVHDHSTSALTSKPETGFFSIRPVNSWLAEAAKTKIPKMLCGPLWFEGEICIFYADTNLGKSIFAVQIADALTKGVDIGPLEVEVEPSKVLYFDFELTKKQFESRYAIRNGDYFEDHFNFSTQFLRAEVNPNGNPPNSSRDLDQYVIDSIETTVVESGAKIVIIDNLTFLESDPEKSARALPLMRNLKAMKGKHGFSLLVLAHTPKRDVQQPLTENHLHGSKMLLNLADSAFAMGKSVQNEQRYIKQIKQRNVEKKYHADNVLLCEAAKETNFLGFNFLGNARERSLLYDSSQDELGRESKVARALELSAQGLTQREIAAELDLSLGTVNNYLKSNEQRSNVQFVQTEGEMNN